MDLARITAEIMSNRKFTGKLYGLSADENNGVYQQELEFYRERTNELTCKLLENREVVEKHLTKDVLVAFDNYVRTCIGFFKTKDMSDLHQMRKGFSPYHPREKEKTEKELEEEALQELEQLGGNDVSYEDADKIMMRQFRVNGMTKFFKRTVSEPIIIIPKQEEIDLQNPELKNKPFFKPPEPDIETAEPVEETQEEHQEEHIEQKVEESMELVESMESMESMENVIEDLVNTVLSIMNIEQEQQEKQDQQHQPIKTLEIEHVEKPEKKRKPRVKKEKTSNKKSGSITGATLDISI